MSSHTPSGEERRGTPRYPVDTRLFASVDGNTVQLRNISLSGVAIRASGLPVGSAHLLELNLSRRHVTLAIEILDISGDRLLHARFVEPSDESQRLIGDYISELGQTTPVRPIVDSRRHN